MDFTKRRPSRETIGERSKTHGESRGRYGRETVEYKKWCGMKRRCLNKGDIGYKRYGERGIFIDESWINSYETFLADMGRCPTGYSLERIDNSGPYTKDNCRWATRSEQARNRRSSVKVQVDGNLILLIEMAESLGLPYHTLYSRRRRGEDLITGKKNVTGGTREQ